jgi:hypothetical protein
VEQEAVAVTERGGVFFTNRNRVNSKNSERATVGFKEKKQPGAETCYKVLQKSYNLSNTFLQKTKIFHTKAMQKSLKT